MNQYKYRVLCPEFDPPKRFQSKSRIPRHLWTTPDRLFVLCETALRKVILQSRNREVMTRKDDFWTVFETLLPHSGRIQLRHHLNDTQSRQREYLNHWDGLALELAQVRNPQLKYPKIIIGKLGATSVADHSSNENNSTKIQCNIKDIGFCEIHVQKKSLPV